MWRKAGIAAGALFALSVLGWEPSYAAPIASTEGEVPGLRLDVTELKRTSGGTLTLKFTVFNDTDKTLSTTTLGEPGAGQDYRSVGGVYLIDAAGMKKYLVVRDADNHCVCSRDIEDIDKGKFATMWAKFPAPPDDVQAMGIVIPHFIPIDDVPVEK